MWCLLEMRGVITRIQRTKLNNTWLVLWNILYFPYIVHVNIPTDELILFRGVNFNHQSDTQQDMLGIGTIHILWTVGGTEMGGTERTFEDVDCG